VLFQRTLIDTVFQCLDYIRDEKCPIGNRHELGRYLINWWKRCVSDLSTFKPVYNDYPLDTKFVAVVDGLSLFRGSRMLQRLKDFEALLKKRGDRFKKNIRFCVTSLWTTPYPTVSTLLCYFKRSNKKIQDKTKQKVNFESAIGDWVLHLRIRTIVVRPCVLPTNSDSLITLNFCNLCKIIILDEKH
jgi:hypothetical protein